MMGQDETSAGRWGAILRHYRETHLPNAMAELDGFRREDSIRGAISRAALAQVEGHKRFPHQFRIRLNSLQGARENLQRAKSKIQACRTFEELHSAVASALADVFGLGELYYYDTSLRLGAYLGILPEKI